MEDFHAMPLSDHTFCGNRCSKHHTLQQNVKKFCPCFVHIYFDLSKVSYSNYSQMCA